MNPASLRRDQKDIIWGKVATSVTNNHSQLRGVSSENYCDDYGFGDEGGGYDDDDDCGGYAGPDDDEDNRQILNSSSEIPSSASNGLDIQLSGGLLQAQRKVEKITIG